MCVCVLMKFCSKFLVPCTQLAVKALMDDGHKLAGEPGSVSSDNVTVCDSVVRLFADWPQMHLVCYFPFSYFINNREKTI